MALVLLFLSSTAALAFSLLLEGGDIVDVKLAVAVEDGDDRLLRALDMLENIPEINQFAKVLKTEPEKAVEYVKRGDAAAALVFPSGFLSSVISGENLPPRLILNTSNALEATLVMKLAQSGVRLLTAAQQGYLYTLHVYDIMQPDTPARDFVDYQSSMRFYLFATGCGELFKKLELESTGALNLMQHYLLSAVFFFAMLSLPVLYPLYSLRAQSGWLLRFRMAGGSRVVYAIAQITAGFLSIFLMLLLLFTGVAAISGSVAAFLSILPAIALSALFFSCFAYFINNVGGILGAVSLNFLLAAIMALSYGGLIPISLLPAPIAALQSFSPLGMMHSACAPLFGVDEGGLLPLLAAACAAGILALAYAKYSERSARL